MKNLSYLLVCAVLIVAACSDDDTNENTAIKKNALSMIVPNAKGSGNVLLLKDGTLANPKSGIADFNSRTAGGKLLLSYKSLGTTDGILNIAVTSYAKADDSTFTVDPVPNIDGEIYAKSFSGTYFAYDQDSTNASTGSVEFSFEAQTGNSTTYHYDFTPEEGSAISGAGKFVVNENTIAFSNNEDDDFILPVGDFEISWSTDMLYLWKVGDNGEFFSYALKRE